MEQHLHQRREAGVGVQRSNDILQAVKQFARWMVDNDRLPKNPFARLKPGNVQTDVRHRRGELTQAEVEKLLAVAAASGETFRGLSGYDRAALYRAAMGTGYRAKELAAVTAEGCSLVGANPTISMPAPKTKNKRAATQPIAVDLAAHLSSFVAGKSGRLWRGSWRGKAAEMFRADLAAAGIPYTVTTAEGVEHRDFHSLRVSYISAVVRTGTDLKTAMTLARHSDPKLTAARYARANVGTLTAAVNAVPGFAPSVSPSVPTPDNGRQGSGSGESEGTLANGYTVPTEVLGKEMVGDGRGRLEAGEEKADSGGRTPDLRFTKSLPDLTKTSDLQGIHASPSPVSSTVSSSPSAYTPNAELARVVELWPSLPPAIRAAVVALVNAAAPTDAPKPAEPELDRLPPGYERSAGK